MSNTVIVTGSRDWADADLLARVLAIHKPTLVVQGGARGADWLALQWAIAAGVAHVTIYADWEWHGRAAGTLRNVEMLKAYPGALVVAFPLPQSRGTYHCIREAVRLGHKVMVVKPSGDWSIVTSKEGFV